MTHRGRLALQAPIVLWLLCGLPLGAQSWDALRDLKPGDRISVLDTAGADHKGLFTAVSADAISLTTGNRQVAVERVRVRRVQVRAGSRRARNALIGAAIGVAVGLTTDYTLGQYFRNEAGESSGARVITYVAPIAVFGGMGAALASYRTVYRAP